MTGVSLATLLGGLTGLFMFAAWRFAFPPPPPLATALARIERRSDITSSGSVAAWKYRLGRRAHAALVDLGIPLDQLDADARITGLNTDELAASKVISAAVPAVFAVAIASMFLLSGVAVPTGALIAGALLGGGAGFLTPDLRLRRSAKDKRREFSLAFGSYLDLVAISLAGGMGTEAALVEAARIGDSWAFRLLRHAIDAAQIDGETVWAAYARLGEELGVSVLVELAASVALAGSEGAKVRSSIATKADTLRAVELAQAETEAMAATETMAVPTAMLLFGFVLLIGFPAVVTVLGGF
jgi:Flp pilus assembly protein TadB